MHDEIDVYIGRCLKNWAVKQSPSSNVKKELLKNANCSPAVETSPLTLFFSAFANRWASPGDQLYTQRHWQFSGSYVQPMIWSTHFATQLRMIQ